MNFLIEYFDFRAPPLARGRICKAFPAANILAFLRTDEGEVGGGGREVGQGSEVEVVPTPRRMIKMSVAMQ